MDDQVKLHLYKVPEVDEDEADNKASGSATSKFALQCKEAPLFRVRETL